MTVLITAAGAVTEDPEATAPHPDTTPRPHWFDPAAHLGRRGWKYFSPATRYLLAAGNQALGRRHDDPPLTGAAAERFGVVTGTQYAIARVHREMDGIITSEGVQGISPAQVPGFSMNTPGSQLAISTGAQAFSVTLTNPVTAGLEAVHFAATALRTGRADRVVAAATDQAPEQGDQYDAAAAVVLSTGRTAESGDEASVLATVTGGICRFVPAGTGDGGRDAAALAAGAARIAALAGAADEVRLVVSGPAAAVPFATAVRDGCAKALADAGVTVRDLGTVRQARHCAVSGLLELVALALEGGPALVVSVSESGHLAAIGLNNSPRS